MADAKLLGQKGAVTEPNGNMTMDEDGAFTSTGTITRTDQLDIDRLSRPAVNPPTVVVQDNTPMLEFTVDTDVVLLNLPIPDKYAGIGGINFYVMWTNDGGVDDNGKAVKVQMSYQTSAVGETIAGSHANSPKSIEDTYTSATGNLLHKTDLMNIAQADLAGKDCIHIKIMFITPAGAALTCEPRMLGMCIEYTAYQVVVA